MFFKEKKDTWKIYRDKLGDKDLLVRVDASMIRKKFKHTYYAAIPYRYSNSKTLPDENESKRVALIEDLIHDNIISYSKDFIFVGCATFGGNSYLTYVSNKIINWENLAGISKFPVSLGVYENDNMGYYNKILYPIYVR